MTPTMFQAKPRQISVILLLLTAVILSTNYVAASGVELTRDSPASSSLRFLQNTPKTPLLPTSINGGLRKNANESLLLGRLLPNVDYAGLGYDALYGNPHGDLHDPGFREPVIELEYILNRTTSDGRWIIPDYSQVLQTVSCSYETDSAEIHGSSSYQDSLSEDAQISVGALGAKFTASFEFKQVHEGTSKYRRGYVSSVARCSSYKVNLNYAYAPFKVTAEFSAAVTSLPTVRDDPAYTQFISAYGTHFASTLYMGSKSVMRSEFESTNWTTLHDEQFDIKFGASASFWIFTVGASSATEKQRKEAETFDSTRRSVTYTYLGSHPAADGKWETWANTTGNSPYPIQYALNPLTDLLIPRYFPQLNDSSLAAKRALFNASVSVYCKGIKGCGIPDPDRPPVNMARGYSSFLGTQRVSCRPGYSLLSCGIDNFPIPWSYDYGRYAVPSGPATCECHDAAGAVCMPWCTTVVNAFDVIVTTGTDEFRVTCPAGKKVLGCHMLPSTAREVWRQHYPTDDGEGCTCYDHFGGLCSATCAADITDHEVRSQFGFGSVDVTCSPGNYVLGCGVKPVKGSLAEQYRTYHVTSENTCQCYDRFGITCYAICGLFA